MSNENIGLLWSWSWQTFRMFINVCLNIFWTAEPFVTTLGMVIHHKGLWKIRFLYFILFCRYYNLLIISYGVSCTCSDWSDDRYIYHLLQMQHVYHYYSKEIQIDSSCHCSVYYSVETHYSVETQCSCHCSVYYSVETQTV